MGAVKVIKDGDHQVNVYLNKRDASILYRILYSVGGAPEGARGMSQELFQGLSDAGIQLPKDVENGNTTDIYLKGPRDVVKPDFKIGTLVKLVAPYQGVSGAGPNVGTIGVVRSYYTGGHTDSVGVEWFGWNKGHDLSVGKARSASLNGKAGWFVPADIIEEYKG